MANTFTLYVHRHVDGVNYGITVAERAPGRTMSVNSKSLNARQVRVVIDRVAAAVVSSGQRPSALGSQSAIELSELSGVRLLLTAMAVATLRDTPRISGIAAGIAAMSIKETYYWYALCVGERRTAALKALRTLLS